MGLENKKMPNRQIGPAELAAMDTPRVSGLAGKPGEFHDKKNIPEINVDTSKRALQEMKKRYPNTAPTKEQLERQRRIGGDN